MSFLNLLYWAQKLLMHVAMAADTPYSTTPITVNTGIRTSFPQIMNKIVSFLAVSSVSVCTALFLIGAFMMVFNARSPDKAAQGKDIMIQSIIGLFVVLGAYGILRTVFYVLI